MERHAELEGVRTERHPRAGAAVTQGQDGDLMLEDPEKAPSLQPSHPIDAESIPA